MPEHASEAHTGCHEAQVAVHDYLVVMPLRATGYAEAISALAERLQQHGYVSDGFLAAVLKREESQPTGLPLPDIPVAIPHAEAEHCKAPAIAVGILERPVEFGEMGGDPGATLPVQIVFLLALNNPEQQVQWLQRLVELFQRPGLLQEMRQLAAPSQVASFLRAQLFPRQADEQSQARR